MTESGSEELRDMDSNWESTTNWEKNCWGSSSLRREKKHTPRVVDLRSRTEA